MKLLKVGYLIKDDNNAEQIFERIINMENTIIEFLDNKITFTHYGSNTVYEYDSHLSARKAYLNLQVKLNPFLTNTDVILSIRKELLS